MTPGWTVERVSGPAAELHAGSAELLRARGSGRTARILVADAPTVVLGSHEPEEWFDRAALARAGLGLARRRSGGGAVLVGPALTAWVDFVIPAGDPLWDDDVGRAGWWVGTLWAEAVAAAGLAPRSELVVWKGGMRPSRWSPVVCFAGVGPGEVELGGRKVVGVSQRRTRGAALFQSAALLDWDPGSWLPLLSESGRRAAAAGPGDAVPPDLGGAAQGLGREAGTDLLSAVHRLLMT